MQKTGVKENLCKLANDLIWDAETVEDMRAVRNILIINDLLFRRENSFFDFERENARLRREYPLIELLERELKQRAGTQTENQQATNESRGDADADAADECNLHLQKLYADTRGIYADVLLKHRRIQCLQEFVCSC